MFGMSIFPGQNANISKSPHQPVQVQSPHISQRGFARILLWNFARCPLHPLRSLVFFKRFLKKHELHSLPALVAIAAENSLLFMAYGATQRLVSRMARLQEEELGVLGHGIAGGLKTLLTPDIYCLIVNSRRWPGCILAFPRHLPNGAGQVSFAGGERGRDDGGPPAT